MAACICCPFPICILFLALHQHIGAESERIAVKEDYKKSTPEIDQWACICAILDLCDFGFIGFWICVFVSIYLYLLFEVLKDFKKATNDEKPVDLT